MKASVISLLLAGLVAAQDFSGQPDCAIPCLKDAIPKAGCALTDTACACKSDVQAKLAGLVAPCLISKCSTSDLVKAQAAAADACKKNAGGSSSAASSEASTTAPSTETTAPSSKTTAPSTETTAPSTETTAPATESTTEAGTTSEATTAPASTTATETTASETSSETTGASSGAPTIPTKGPSGVSNSTVSGTRSVVTRTSTAFVGGGGDGGSKTSGAPASTTLAGNDAAAPVAGVLGAVLAALMAL